MATSMFKLGWFILMELVTVGCIAGIWMELVRHSMWAWEFVGLGATATALFVGSNVLLLRGRHWVWSGLVICWLLLVVTFLLWPVV